jgi:hypothetical protein
MSYNAPQKVPGNCGLTIFTSFLYKQALSKGTTFLLLLILNLAMLLILCYLL